MIIAKYPSKCSVCNKPIVPRRDEIRTLWDGIYGWVHIRCYDSYWHQHQLIFKGTLDDTSPIDFDQFEIDGMVISRHRKEG